MSNLQAIRANAPRQERTTCDAAWVGPGRDDWARGLTRIRRQERIDINAMRLPGEGLFLSDIPGRADFLVPEEVWVSFARGDTTTLTVEIDSLCLRFQREDLAGLLPRTAKILTFPRVLA